MSLSVRGLLMELCQRTFVLFSKSKIQIEKTLQLYRILLKITVSYLRRNNDYISGHASNPYHLSSSMSLVLRLIE